MGLLYQVCRLFCAVSSSALKTPTLAQRISVNEIIKNKQIITNSRKIIPPFELDIFVASLSKAIEVNGNYWHSDERFPQTIGGLTFQTVTEYHEYKTSRCKQLGVDLIHISESDWNTEQELVQERLTRFLKV